MAEKLHNSWHRRHSEGVIAARRTVLGLLLAAGVALAAPPSARPDPEAAAAAIGADANRFRAEQGLPALVPEPRLAAAAAGFARHMARTDRYGHDADGRQPNERVAAQGYDGCVVLENIAYAQSSAGFATDDLVRRLMEGWKQSPGHRRNLLDPTVDETGVGLAQSERSGRWYAVQLFARPRARAFEFSVANPTARALRYRAGSHAFVLEPGMTRTHTQCVATGLVFEGGAGQPELRLEPKAGEHWEVREDGAGVWRLRPAVPR